MELIRYRPGEAIRWLELGARDLKKNAQRTSKGIVRREGERTIGRDVLDAAGILVDIGKGTLAELMHRQALASEYILHESYFEIVSPNRIRSVQYDDVRSLRMRGDKATLVLRKGSVTIKPHAYIVSGRVKVPLGWSRNGLEVPYEVMIDEMAARCDVEIERAA